jgi:hypothetical protein
MRASLADRFFARVDRSVDACWLWTGARTTKGYGKIKQAGRRIHAHRVAWELTNGPIPEGLQVSHRCRERLCVNPAHLYLATAEQNRRRFAAAAAVYL